MGIPLTMAHMDQGSQQQISEMFNRISPHYDRVNRILSFGIDRYWRKKLSDYLPLKETELLDCATGTCDQLLSLAKKPQIKRIVGIDLAEKMLAIGKEKVRASPYADKIELICADVMRIPDEGESFDCITLSFGLRNVKGNCLPELYRVLKRGGRVLILEFSLPKNRCIRVLHLFYLRKILPLLGGWISGNRAAYLYLNQTIEAFPPTGEFVRKMASAGFTDLIAKPLTFGIATLYVGKKP